ncbi:MAG: type IV pilus modification protein PilV [Gammaproteobacteria bacterium]|nr:type IV pilus modification protein PilV [Gammaproteobacteria bacterium]
MMEVLVTVVILSVGMLGIAALYVESLKSGQTALARTKAINLAADMADRVRVNRAGESFYNVGNAAAGATPVAQCGARNTVAAEECTAEEMAAYDIWLWKTMIGNSTVATARQSGLANASASIVRDASTLPITFTIQIAWSDRDDNQDYTLSFAL